MRNFLLPLASIPGVVILSAILLDIASIMKQEKRLWYELLCELFNAISAILVRADSIGTKYDVPLFVLAMSW